VERARGGGRSDRDLAAGLVARDEAALGELFDRYGGLAYSVALRILDDPGKAEDVVQEAFLKLWHGAARFDESRGSLRTWLTTAVRNRSIDLLRGRSLHERRELALNPEVRSTQRGPEEQAEGAMDRAAVRSALAELPEEQRQAVLLAYFGGFTQAEIAEQTGVPLSTVKGRMRLALEKLAAYLKERGLVDV
jgi:RNA polymerase sigma factor (sigma-70 family)